MKRLKKSKKNCIFAGVAGGLGKYYNVDPVLFRLAFVFVPHLVAVYIVLALILEEE